MRHFAICLALLLAAPAAHAEPSSADVARSDALFREGRALMDKGDLAAACPKLEDSLRLAPRLGTMLNLGACYERRGSLARAISIYERAATMAREAGRHDRERAARELAAGLEAKVAKIIVDVDAPPPGLVLEIDGDPISLHGGLIPIDPGTRSVRASAPGKKTWTSELVASAGATMRLRVPPLENESGPPAPAPAAAAPPAKASIAWPEPPKSTAGPTVAVASAAVIGVAGIAVGTVFGLRALSKRNEANDHCDDAGCDAAGVDLLHDAHAAGNLSTGAFVVGAVGLAAAVILYLTLEPKGDARAAQSAGVVRF